MAFLVLILENLSKVFGLISISGTMTILVDFRIKRHYPAGLHLISWYFVA
ncbi:hypothetical protein IHE45_17G086200 [Dioscorea alata]|uniref:Uncharacterized protein n=1 Tax=Dioscorea alata TaxID=55571 RepID=A0ACB7UDT1_DIOAL|nr:hypothetical protein IHE45_17G086200 [Dioscorea alata]